MEDLAKVGFLRDVGLVEVPSSLTFACAGGCGSASKIDHGFLVSSSFAQAVRFAGDDSSAPWGTHLALKFEVEAQPRKIEVLRQMAPKALDILTDKETCWELSWGDAMGESGRMLALQPSKFKSNLAIASSVGAQRDSLSTARILGNSLSQWAVALELVTCAKKILSLSGPCM